MEQQISKLKKSVRYALTDKTMNNKIQYKTFVIASQGQLLPLLIVDVNLSTFALLTLSPALTFTF